MAEEHPLPIILASASPRRKQLLTEAGYRFTVVTPDVDESAFPTDGVSACDYTKRLALAKANSVGKARNRCIGQLRSSNGRDCAGWRSNP